MTTGFMTLSEVDRRAGNLGMSYGQYVAKYRSDEVIKPRSVQKPTSPVNLESRRGMRRFAKAIVAMYGAGDSISGIAEKVGVPELDIARFIKHSGLTREECLAGTTFSTAEDDIEEDKPCNGCKVRYCDNRKMCEGYKRWVSYAWNKAVAPFRALQSTK